MYWKVPERAKHYWYRWEASGKPNTGKLENWMCDKHLPLAQQNAHPVLSWILLCFPFHMEGINKISLTPERPSGISFCCLCPVWVIPLPPPTLTCGTTGGFMLNMCYSPFPKLFWVLAKRDLKILVSQKCFVLTCHRWGRWPWLTHGSRPVDDRCHCGQGSGVPLQAFMGTLEGQRWLGPTLSWALKKPW